jgi:hypothetical protein
MSLRPTFLIALLPLLFACGRGMEEELTLCANCPNNMRCIEDRCDCPPGDLHLGSWCLQRRPNLFLGVPERNCPCFEPFALEMRSLTELPDGSLAVGSSGFSLFSRKTNAVFLAISLTNHAALADSLILLGFPLPTVGEAFSFCQVEGQTTCRADLHGRFLGRDTIRAEIIWRACGDGQGNPTVFRDTCRFWMVRVEEG